ncbi:MAG: SMI1/KNR4 family protein [Paludibacteraceae bacterium]|nr:SMI1/KNR4 family protein [Paludibacteraceae bacterium]
MINKQKRIIELLYTYSKYGQKNNDDGTLLIGHPNYLKENWWLVEMFPTLKDNDINYIKSRCTPSIPETYEKFLRNVSNGLIFQFGSFYLYGLVTSFNRNIDSRQPFDIFLPNIDERALYNNVKENYFFIGGYSDDGSQLCIDVLTNKVHLCSEDDATSLLSWDNFDDMLISELTRLYALYSDDGRIIDEDKSVSPL